MLNDECILDLKKKLALNPDGSVNDGAAAVVNALYRAYGTEALQGLIDSGFDTPELVLQLHQASEQGMFMMARSLGIAVD